MKGNRGGLLLAAAATAVTLLASEAAVRLFWRDAPPLPGGGDTLPLIQIADPEILYRLVPSSAGSYSGTAVRINDRGLRGPDASHRAAAGIRRVLVLGDSMVFGVGLDQEETIPSRLAAALSAPALPVEAINAGVFGYNMKQERTLLRDTGLEYAPDAVIACFVHNDIENWGLGEKGQVPEIRSARFDPPPAGAWSSKLAAAMLPGTFDEGRLNLLPKDGSAGFRGRLASLSRLYLFTYLRLRTHSWNLTSGERRDPLVDARTCQTERVIWNPIREEYRQMKRLAESSGARFGVVILGGLLWEGAPLVRLRRLLAEEAIPYLDLTPAWHSPERYAAEFSLGWDPHPNAVGADLAAGLMARFVRDAGLLERGGASNEQHDGSPYWSVISHPGMDGWLRSWRDRERKQVGEDDARWAEILTGLEASVDLAAPAPGQVLYGFWGDDATLPPVAAVEGKGRWLSSQGSFLFPGAGAGARFTLELAMPSDSAARGRAPRILKIGITSPPDRCEASVIELELPAADADGRVRLEVPVPESFWSAPLLEVELSVDRPVQSEYLSRGVGVRAGGDHRLISVHVRRAGVVR